MELCWKWSGAVMMGDTAGVSGTESRAVMMADTAGASGTESGTVVGSSTASGASGAEQLSGRHRSEAVHLSLHGLKKSLLTGYFKEQFVFLDVHMALKGSPSLKEYVASNQSTTPDVNFASGSQKKRTKAGVSLP